MPAATPRTAPLPARPATPGAGPLLHLHGAAAVRQAGGRPLALERKHAALLAWLWLEGPTPRARLAGLLWPEVGESRARATLRQRLLKLRQAAGDLVVDRDGLLALAADVTVADPSPPDAVLLADLAFDDCEALARWLDARRDDERAHRKRAWLGRVREAAQSQQLDEALYAADQLLRTDRESEEAFRVLMEVYYLRGDHAAALSAWDRCRDMLRQLYGVPPSAATQALGRSILQAAEAAGPTLATSAGNDSATPAPDRPGPAGLTTPWRPAAALPAPPAPPAAPAGPTPPARTLLPQLPASVLRPPRLVGRDAALAALQAGHQAGQVLCVAGEAGVGKSRLLADWAATLAPPHAQVAAHALALARPGDAVLPYASLSRLVLAVVDRFGLPLDSADARQAARVLPRLAGWIAQALPGQPTPEPVRTDYERTQALLALARWLASAGARGCRLLVLDDLHLADAASTAALLVLAEPPAGPIDAAAARPPALRWAFGLRPDEAPAEVAALLQSLRTGGHVTDLRLAPLDNDAAHALLASLDLPDVDVAAWAHTWTPRLLRQVGGNPAFLLESVKLLLSTGSHLPPEPPAAAPAPASAPATLLPAAVQAVIARRLELLSPPARHLAQLAVIADAAFSIPLAASALACPPIALGEPLRELELRQVYAGHQFVHDVIAAVVRATIPQAVAEFMHRFVAEHLQQQHGDDPAHAATQATHWAAAGDWARAGRGFRIAADAARAASLADQQAAMLDQAIAAFERDPAAQEALFLALCERADVFEASGHEGLRPQLIERLEQGARSEWQQISARLWRWGWLVNQARPIDEDAVQRDIGRAEALHDPDLAWTLRRMLGMHWAMHGRADDALALIAGSEAWIGDAAPPDRRLSYRMTRSSIHAFSDRLAPAVAEGQQAIALALQAGDWNQALPAMSNTGVMLYWSGRTGEAIALLEQARQLREQRFGPGGAGIKIDYHLGGALLEADRHDEALQALSNACTEMHRWPVNDYQRTELLLAENHLAALHLRCGRHADAAQVLAGDVAGLSDRFVLRRLALRLRWQRLTGQPTDPALLAEAQATAQRVPSAFNRGLAELEIARHLGAAEGAVLARAVASGPAAAPRPGLRLHALALAAARARESGLPGEAEAARADAAAARALQSQAPPFDLPPAELQALLLAAEG